MAMDEGLDTGPMLSKAEIDISEQDTTASLTQALETLGGSTLITTLDDLESSLKGAAKQPADGVTYAHKITKKEAAIDWRLSAVEISRKIRALSPSPGCFGVYNEERIKIWEARPDATAANPANPPGTLLALTKNGLIVACGDGGLVITRLQLPNKKPMSLPDIMNGHKDRLVVGDRFASPEI